MSNPKILSLLLAAALALPAVSMSADQPLTKSETTEVRATVVTVDQKTRMVTLKGEDGKNFEVEAGSAVQHLDQVKPGDIVVATYTESLAFQVANRGERPAGVSQSARKNVGSAEIGHTVTSSFRIASYDRNTHVLWATTAKGETKKVTVQDPQAQARLAKLSPGNVVKVTYTESLAIKLEKVAK
jgi:hypothetical protein